MSEEMRRAWTNLRELDESRPRVLWTVSTCPGDGKTCIVPVVPSADGASCHHHLGDGHALSLATRYAADKVVADLCVVRMAEPEDGHDDASNVLGRFTPGHVADPIRGRSAGGGKLERLADSQMGEVLVHLGLSARILGVRKADSPLGCR